MEVLVEVIVVVGSVVPDSSLPDPVVSATPVVVAWLRAAVFTLETVA